MAVITKTGRSISYDCSELIEELRQDIAEFGNFTADVIVTDIEDATVYKSYNFHTLAADRHSLTSVLKPGERIEVIPASELLAHYIEQNDLF